MIISIVLGEQFLSAILKIDFQFVCCSCWKLYKPVYNRARQIDRILIRPKVNPNKFVFHLCHCDDHVFQPTLLSWHLGEGLYSPWIFHNIKVTLSIVATLSLSVCQPSVVHLYIVTCICFIFVKCWSCMDTFGHNNLWLDLDSVCLSSTQREFR